MNFEWDDQKDATNKRKHGISFQEACEIFKSPILTKIDERYDYGEIREISYGMIAELVVIAVVHTDRTSGTRRIISARKAKKSERKLFYEYLGRTLG